MKRIKPIRKAARYVWHGMARLGETAIFLTLLPLILLGALRPDRPAATVQKTAKAAVTSPVQPHP